MFTHEIEAATSEQSAGAEQVGKATYELTRLTQEISAATEEQSTGASEVVRAMEQMRDMVRQSSEMATGLQGSAEDLYRQSEGLQGVVKRFKIGDDDKLSDVRGRDQMRDMPFVPGSSVMRQNGAHHPVN
jgi:methyl-accepting chemotaxis protein